jgi:uncharacterized protein (DUF4415 family)
MPDDVSTLEGWTRARHRLDPIATKVPTRRVTINLDEDIIATFKAEAFLGGPPYQVAINQALRSYLRTREMSERERAAHTVLAALEDQAVVERLRELL